MSKQKIAVDLDDTLAATIEGTLAYASRRLGKQLSHGDITAIEYWAEYGVSDTEAIALVHDYNLEGFPGLQPIKDARQCLEACKDRYEYYIVTAREETIAKQTRVWLDRYFPDLFTDVVFAGNPYVNKQARSKETICWGLGVECLIDDSTSHAVVCARIGIHVILFGGHAWHGQAEQHPLIIPAANWEEVRRQLNGKG